MKFKRDNTKVALTQEMKDAAIKEQQEKQENEQRLARIKRKEVEKRRVAEINYENIAKPLITRQRMYPPVIVQLDKLWHDMDDGYIKVDKRAKNTWYNSIKNIKDAAPLEKTWKSDLHEAYKEIMRLNTELDNANANNNNQNI